MTVSVRYQAALAAFALIYLLYAIVSLLIGFDALRSPGFWPAMQGGAVVLLVPTVYVVYKRSQQLLDVGNDERETDRGVAFRGAPGPQTTEISTTGVVRRRNENGYFIHPDRHDTGEFDRRFGAVLLFSGGLLLLLVGAEGVVVAVGAAILGSMLLYRGRTKRKRVGGYRL